MVAPVVRCGGGAGTGATEERPGGATPDKPSTGAAGEGLAASAGAGAGAGTGPGSCCESAGADGTAAAGGRAENDCRWAGSGGGGTAGFGGGPGSPSCGECVAAQKLGLPFVGVEINEEYVKLIKSRLDIQGNLTSTSSSEIVDEGNQLNK